MYFWPFTRAITNIHKIIVSNHSIARLTLYHYIAKCTQTGKHFCLANSFVSPDDSDLDLQSRYTVVENVLLVCSAVMVYDHIVATRVSMQTVALESLLGSIYLQHKLFQRRFDDKAEFLSPSDEKHLPLPTCKAASSLPHLLLLHCLHWSFLLYCSFQYNEKGQ